MLNKLKIAIAVHGRFHAFDLARELINLGHDVTLLTNYPQTIIQEFGITAKCVRSFILHGILVRILTKVPILNNLNYEPFIHRLFARWAAKVLLKDDYDIVYVFSGIAEEVFQTLANKSVWKILARGSSHIITQFQLLDEEEIRAGIKIDKPSAWRIAREEREYQQANSVTVLSSFAYQSFIEQQFPTNKLSLILSGNQVEKFRPNKGILEERCQRILSDRALRILMVGTFSFRKGAKDLAKIAEFLGEKFEFRFVGSIDNETKYLSYQDNLPIEFIPRQPHFKLPLFYAWADIFIFTTIEDGYAVVLAQANASGLPIIATPNSSAPDIIVENQTGWIVPIRDPEAFVERLQWCDEHRAELAQMVWKIYQDFQPRDWSDVARDFIQIHQDLSAKNLASTGYE